MEIDRQFGNSRDDLPEELIGEAKHKSRMNAMILIAVFLAGIVLPVASLAPSPWNVVAPTLSLIPMVYAIVQRIRKPGASGERLPETLMRYADFSDLKEPYSCTPKDPKNPRRYKPIE